MSGRVVDFDRFHVDGNAGDDCSRRTSFVLWHPDCWRCLVGIGRGKFGVWSGLCAEGSPACRAFSRRFEWGARGSLDGQRLWVEGEVTGCATECEDERASNAIRLEGAARVAGETLE